MLSVALFAFQIIKRHISKRSFRILRTKSCRVLKCRPAHLYIHFTSARVLCQSLSRDIEIANTNQYCQEAKNGEITMRIKASINEKIIEHET